MPVRPLGWTFLIGMLGLNNTQFHSRLGTQLNTPRLCTSHVLRCFYSLVQNKLKNKIKYMKINAAQLRGSQKKIH